MKSIKFRYIFPGLLLIIFYSCGASFQLSSDEGLTQPEWAAGYDNQGIYYYYFPDYGFYYDVPDHEYVYMDDGNWVYSPDLPPMYASIDLYNAYVVGLDHRVHDPWRHHWLYASHYPPYYYRNHEYERNVRGYNENNARTFSRRNENEHHEARSTVPEQSGNVRSSNPSENNRRTQPIQYNNHKVGRPVRVRRDMRSSDNNNANSQRQTESNQKSSNSNRRR